LLLLAISKPPKINKSPGLSVRAPGTWIPLLVNEKPDCANTKTALIRRVNRNRFIFLKEFRHFFGLTVCILKFMYIFHFRSEKQELRKQIAVMASKVANRVQD
jgi:predicted Ser/Thr protein kinase